MTLSAASRAGLALSAAVLLSSASPALADTRFAIIVGHNFGDASETPLRWAEADATRFRAALTDVGDVHDGRAQTLLGPDLATLESAWQLTRGAIREANHRGEHTTLFFYFSGHGDKQAVHLKGERLSVDDLQSELRSAGADTVVAIVDACQNDRSPRRRNKGSLRAPAFAWPARDSATPSGFVYLTSAASGEVAQESDDLQGSLFTHHLVAGMRGSADADGDGAVTLSELYGYGYARTLADTHGRTLAVQHSELDVALAGQGSVVLAYPARSASILALADTVRGHLLLVHDGSGRIVGEHQRAAGGPARLALPAGRYRIQLRNSDGVRVGLIEVAPGVNALDLPDLEIQDLHATLSKGAAYDPFPWMVVVGMALGTPIVDGYGARPALRFGAAYRAARWVQVGAQVDATFSTGGNPAWRYRQGELAASATADALLTWDDLALTAGARAGVIMLQQDGDRVGPVPVIGLDAASTSSDAAMGPLLGLSFGVQSALSNHISVRFAFEPGVAVLRIDEVVETRRIAAGALSAIGRF